MRVFVFAPSEDAASYVAYMAGKVGDAEVFDVPQDMCSALYRDPDALAIVWNESAQIVAFLVREWRAAGVKNVIFALVEQLVGNKISVALERVSILAAGADDVQPHPIDPREFVARIDALSRRGPYNDHLHIQLPGCVFDVNTGLLATKTNRKATHLTPKEGRLLQVLAMEPDRTFNKTDLLERLYDTAGDEPELKIVDVWVCKLRRKIVKVTNGLDVIETIWGRGYRFVPAGFRPQEFYHTRGHGD